VSSLQILIISPDVIGNKMAGPGIRYYEIARVLSREFMVTLAAPNNNFPPSSSNLDICCHNDDNIKTLYAQADLVICQGFITKSYPFLLKGKKPLVIDLYDLIHVEELAKGVKYDYTTFNHILRMIMEQLKYGDYFICASERQRDFWLGMLSVLGRINHHTFNSDITLRSLINLVPFGLPSEAPCMTRKTLKGVYPRIRQTDKVILWAGGIWDWLDPFTPIKAMQLIGEQRDDVKLFFMGIERPSRDKPLLTLTAKRAVKLSKELKLFNRLVFFNEDWVPYLERQNYLLNADLGIATYRNSLETHYAWRTRLMDYLWAGLPVLCNGGDGLSSFIRGNALGLVISHSNEHKLAEAILYLLNARRLKTYRNNILSIRHELTWEKAAAPLISFCRHPQRAADKRG
jgi:glycosyltransferase involved in cell wall biosynthesis